jgi:CubicO group peptidase (beta-lactamase class C family)
LQDGVWSGERVLPGGFVDFVSSPAPGWDEPVYGGLFWLNGDGAWSIPESAYFMAGGGGQRTFVIPTHDLVVVRLGHFAGDAPGMRTLDQALARLMDAIPPVG